MVLILERGHGRLLAGTDGIGLPLSVGARWVGAVQLRTLLLVHSANEEGHTVGPRHRLPLTSLVALTKVDSEVRDRLSDGFDPHRLIEVKGMVLSLYTAMIDENTSITDDSTHSTGTMTVHLDKFLTAALWYHEGCALQLLLHTEDHTFVSFHADGRGTKLYRVKQHVSENDQIFVARKYVLTKKCQSRTHRFKMAQL